MAAPVQVRLAGSATKVALGPEDGLGALKSRVAGAFGLTAPFDLIGPEGRLSTDEDARAVTKADSELRISTGEDALLDLERAREESGVLRWALLRQILGDLKVRLAEMAAELGEGRHKAAQLEQQLAVQRDQHQAGQANLKAELAELRELQAVELHKARQEAERRVTEATSSLGQQLAALETEQVESLQSKEAALQEAIQQEKTGRQREADETLRRLQDLRAAAEAEAQRAAAKSAALEARLAELGTRLAEEAELRQALGKQLEQQLATGAAERERLEATQTASGNAWQQRAAELSQAMQVEKESRGSQLDVLQRQLKDLAQESEAKLAQAGATWKEQLEEVKEMEPKLRSLVAEQAEGVRQQQLQQLESLQELAGKLEEESVDRRQTDQRTAGMVSSIQVAMGREQRAREAAGEAAGRASGALEAQLAAAEQSAAEAQKAQQAALEHLATEFHSLKIGEEAARTKCRDEVEAAQQSRHQALAEELRRTHERQTEESRQWAQTLVERLSTDLRAEREALFQELHRRCEEVAKLNTEQIRLEMAAEVKKVDATTCDVLQKHRAALDEEKRHYERQAQVAASEVKAALDAHGDFAEALEQEQRLIVERLTEALQKEGTARHELMKRLGSLEIDVQKVRGHLPILFASPTAFR
ncbi:unnamed protein product [Effrenium voratum]|uniref:Uncharacterized protein n=1 Tax=Effrenium voratum TaxID=2562239 RepID=A0AA36IAJ0_9DINO|nr:unnamed protein product [Effrenium voratum]CAJ1418732.1 unnamed protein product [Effrenium voratum]